MENRIPRRIIQKHDTEENWLKAENFIPLEAEWIIYDEDTTHRYKRIKLGDGKTNVNQLPFVIEGAILNTLQIKHNEQNVYNLLDSYILNINYELLAFDTTEIVIGATSTTSVLGQAILGQMVLA